jgi:hypothetical protein
MGLPRRGLNDRMKRRHVHPGVFAVVLSTAVLSPAAWPQADEAPATVIENCVGSDLIEVHAGTDSALLGDSDRAEVQAAMVARYAPLAGGGFAPAAIMLWRSPSFGWVYLALNSHPDKPGKVCSTGSFSAAAFGFSGTLLRKYFFSGRI